MNRREQGDLLWKQRFDAIGMSVYFELINRDWDADAHGGLASVRCKTCGTLFKTWNVRNCIYKNAKTLICPQCGQKSDGNVCWPKSEACRKALAYYADGHSVLETAEKFGVPDYYVENAATKSGISNGRDFHEAGAEVARRNLLKGAASAKNNAEKRRKQILDGLGLDYIESIGISADAKICIRCRVCGHVFERCVTHVNRCDVRCPKCAEAERIRQAHEREIEAQKKKERRIAEREAERIRINPLGLSYYQLSVQAKLDVIHVCEICGNEYTVRTRMEKEGLKYCTDNGCCSDACARKKNHRKNRMNGYSKSHRHRARKYGCEYDGTVTLKRLIKRNGLRCGICGGTCDPNDHSWTDYFGAMSPTIDHIIPMSKGGGHTWDNVQVAHAICNSKKRDNLEEEIAHEAS